MREDVSSALLFGKSELKSRTLARLIAKTADADFKELSATR